MPLQAVAYMCYGNDYLAAVTPSGWAKCTVFWIVRLIQQDMRPENVGALQLRHHLCHQF